ncbi:MAG: hypothetical protein WBG50_05085 [Desulfomonilaceae bacterium]
MRKIMSLAIVILLATVSASNAAEKRIMHISKDGKTVTLEDGSVYQIDPSNFAKTFKWLTGDTVRFRENKGDEWDLTHVTDPLSGRSAARATRIR